VKSEGKIVIPKGAKLVGHVTQASARTKGESESALGIVFDKAILKNGQEIPLSAGFRRLPQRKVVCRPLRRTWTRWALRGLDQGWLAAAALLVESHPQRVERSVP